MFMKTGMMMSAVVALGMLGATPANAQDDTTPVCTDGVVCLEQGWNDAQRNWWYSVTQGSRLLPLKWMLALEQAESTPEMPRMFLDAENVERLGYLPNPKKPSNPHGLPVGFVVDHDKSRNADLMCDTFPAACDGLLMRQEWVGLNCSACHTNEIQLDGKRLRIEGAPALADFQRMEEDLAAALQSTLDDRDKFDRFARNVLGSDLSIESREMLEAQIIEQLQWQKLLLAKNATPIRYGHGRLDAQGHILNKIAATTGVDDGPNRIAADAPASYPFIWNTSQQGKIQWNGIANNIFQINLLGNQTDVGALIRNTSEVIGVFAHIDTKSGKAIRGYDSSLRLREMVSLERQLASLESPRWPEDLLGPIDWDSATRGKQVFDRLGCESCHQPLASTDVTSPLQEHMLPLVDPNGVSTHDSGTDILLACNTFLHRAKSGNFEGQKIFAVKGERIQATDLTRNLLTNAAIGAVAGKLDELALSLFTDVAPEGDIRAAGAPTGDPNDYLPGVSDMGKKALAQACLTRQDPILAYKARSLNGVWATAPYLHNGSVPTLYDLFLPGTVHITVADAEAAPAPTGETRPETFGVGTRVFDPKKVGFVTDSDANPFVYHVRDPLTNEPIPGNYNSGHDYGTSGLSETERLDLVEYIKTL